MTQEKNTAVNLGARTQVPQLKIGEIKDLKVLTRKFKNFVLVLHTQNWIQKS